MSEWKEVAIEEICTVQRGGSPRPIHDFLAPVGTPWIKISDATGGNARFIDSTEEFIRPEGESKSRVVQPGAFIVSNSATPGLPRFVRIRACIHDGWLFLSDFRNVDQWFLHYKLKAEREMILLKGNGSIFTNLKTSILKEHRIALPVLEEQRAIASVLSSLDEKIDLLHRQNKTLEAMAETLFRQWFVEEAEEGWVDGTLDQILSVKGGTTPSTKNPEFWDGDIHWTTPRDLSSSADLFLFDTARRITERGLAEIGSGLLPSGTLLMSSRAPVGYLAFADMPVAVNQGYIAIIDDKGIGKHFIYLWLKANMDQVHSYANGSTFQEISKAAFKTLELTIPPPQRVDDFEKVVQPLFQKIRANLLQVRKLSSLRDMLLPKLMSGEVRVSEELLTA